MPSVLENDALAMYVAAAVALVVLIGFFWYLWSIDRAVASLRRQIDQKEAMKPPQIVTPIRPQPRIIEQSKEQVDGNTGR